MNIYNIAYIYIVIYNLSALYIVRAIYINMRKSNNNYDE